MKSEVVSAAIGEVSDRIEVLLDDEDVARKLAANIIERDTFEVTPDAVIEQGVEAAIEEIDDGTFDAAFDVIQSAVNAEVESRAKAIALRMLRQLAATAPREEVAAG